MKRPAWIVFDAKHAPRRPCAKPRIAHGGFTSGAGAIRCRATGRPR